jgi:hypothetical protein
MRTAKTASEATATREQLREMVTAVPFLPFTVKLASGNSFTVRHPELASCSVNGRSMWIHDDAGTHLVEMLLVEVMEPVMSPPERGGNGPGPEGA